MTQPAGHPIEFLPELALGVLGGAEAQAIREHLQSCSACREEFAELERVAGLLPLAAEAPAPGPGLREALLRRARDERRRRPHIAPPRWTLGLAAGLLLLAAGSLLGWLAAPRSPAGEASDLARRDALLAAAARGDTIRAGVSAPGGISASVLVDPVGGLAIAVLDGLPQAPEGRTYQGWLLEGQEARPAGLLPGDGSLFLAPGGDFRRFTAFALTLEAAGGVPAPTGAPLIVVPFALTASR